MENNFLKISVVTVSYNQAQFIAENIQSVIEQNYPNVEHIIIDGGSTDGTLDILKKYDGYEHIDWTSEPDRGQSHGLNKGFKKMTGDIICWLNSDDLLCDKTLTKLNNYFQKNPHHKVIVGNLIKIDEKGNYLETKKGRLVAYDGLLNGSQCVQQMSTFFRKEVFDNVGLLDESYHYSMDHEFWIRVAAQYNFHTIDEDLAKMRKYGETKSSTNEIGFVKDHLRIKKKFKAKVFRKNNLTLIMMLIKHPFKKIEWLRRLIRKIKGVNPDFHRYK